MSSPAPVIIAGAGPAGCALGLSLARQDIPVLLLERELELPVDLRASTFHPPTLEMLDELGIAEEMVNMGLQVSNYQYRDRNSGDVANFDMGLIAGDTPFPFRLQLEQYEMTRIAARHISNLPAASLRYRHEVLDFSQAADGVAVRVKTPAGETVLQGAFLIGADGARSVVRKQADIGYMGFAYEEKFLVASTSFPFETIFDGLAWVNYVADPDEWCVILRTDKLWRVLWPTRPDQSDDELLSDAYIQARLKHLHARDQDYEIGHRTLYEVHQRVAENYFRDRVALVGDACHINNPLGGMGMNGGIHDAINLAGKLAEIYVHGADWRAGFEHYERQRRDLAVRFVQDHTIANKKLMEEMDPDQQLKRQRWLMETAADPAKAREFLLERAMINCLNDSLQVV